MEQRNVYVDTHPKDEKFTHWLISRFISGSAIIGYSGKQQWKNALSTAMRRVPWTRYKGHRAIG